MLAPLSNYWGGGAGPPGPPSSYAYELRGLLTLPSVSTVTKEGSSCADCGLESGLCVTCACTNLDHPTLFQYLLA